MDLNVIGDSLMGQEDTASTHPLDSNIVEGSPSPKRRKTEKSSASCRRVYKHDVFLSFRGTDTRNNFTDHLYNNLIRKGVFTFKDDKRLEKGQSISPQLLQAIRDSRVSIVVFSRDYAASTWCLEEMAAIANCQEGSKQTVFPVFYDVDPSHVRNQNGVYENAFVLHKEKFKEDPDNVDRWKRAMTKLANLAGWDVRDKPQFTQIENIIQKVIKTLDHKFSGFADDLIGINPRVEELEKLLKLSSEDDDFRVLGICGMGGIGKTTHATTLYDRISYQFDASCFIQDVSKNYREGGAIALQKQILCQALDEQNLDTYSPSEISGIVRNRLSPVTVLIVLDNVDELEQLQKLAVNPKLLRIGSRVVMTTRDKHILEVYGADAIHEVPALNDNDARELFLRKAFKRDGPSSRSCVELTPNVLKYVQNLPLAIEVVGSFLYKRDATQWRDALNRLREEPDNKIMDVLQISFEGLKSKEKEIFLHIACFFHGEREDYLKRILDCCGLYPHIGIPVIAEKSLITIRNQEIYMHEMLQELGKRIVREKFPEEPRLWSRLWLYQDFFHVLMSTTGTSNVKAIVIDQKVDVRKYSHCRVEGFSKMRSLKLLILHHKYFSGSLNFLSENLQYLLWHGYPFSSLPSNFESYCLVELNLPSSRIKRLWEGSKNFCCLQRVDLSNSKDLLETPNFELSPSLKRLDLSGCTNLLHIHPSIGLLTELVYLNLRDCSSLVSLDLGTECKLSSLIVLHLFGCTNLCETPDFTGLSNLEYLDLEQCTSLFTVHESIGALATLKFLSLRGCINLVEMPNSINNMVSLQTLDLHGWLKVVMKPIDMFMPSSWLGSLIFLDLGFCNLREIPYAIGGLWCLERLNIEGNHVNYIPDTIKELSRLAYLNLVNCRQLTRLPELPFDSASSGGRYFKTVSTSRNHRSGLYVFNCKALRAYWVSVALSWLARLVEQPCHFRCGFDIVIPVHSWSKISQWYFNHQFEGGSIIRIVDSNVDDNWTGFAFCVVFEVKGNNPQVTSSSLSQLPRHLYLSFESEHVEECFDMPLGLDKEHVVAKSNYFWIIYISRVHCHFVKTGARITFKAHPDFKVQKWGLRMVFKQDIEVLKRELHRVGNQGDGPRLSCFRERSFVPKTQLPDYRLGTEDAHKSSSNPEPKIQLPYNWLVTEEEENENMDAKAKENNLANMGFSRGQPQ